MKQCKVCGQPKPASDFPTYARGRCRSCKNAYWRDWKRTRSGAAHLAARRERRDADRRAWDHRNADRLRIVMRACHAVERAILRGDLVRPSACEQCGASGSPIDAAHFDYRPENYLRVRWLCRRCHVAWDQTEPKSLAANQASVQRAA